MNGVATNCSGTLATTDRTGHTTAASRHAAWQARCLRDQLLLTNVQPCPSFLIR